MSKGPRLAEIGPCLTRKGLHQALDHAYRQFLETAKADWQRLFAASDRADKSVSVRVSTAEIGQKLAGMPRAGLAKIIGKQMNRRVRGQLA